MIYNILADLIVLVHFIFAFFTILGGFFVLKWKYLIKIHIPAVIWGIIIELTGWTCPLTPLENLLRIKGGGTGYNSEFIEHYILPVLYPSILTRNLQIILGILLLIINAGIYGYMIIFLNQKKRRNTNNITK